MRTSAKTILGLYVALLMRDVHAHGFARQFFSAIRLHSDRT